MNRVQKGSALQTFLFALSVTVAVGTAVIAIYKAYGEFIVKPREPSRIASLESENHTLLEAVAALEASNAELRDQVRVLKKQYAEEFVAAVQGPLVDEANVQQKALRELLLHSAERTVLTASTPKEAVDQLIVANIVKAAREPAQVRARAWIGPTVLLSVSLVSVFVAWRVRKRVRAQGEQRERMRAYA